MYFIIKNSPLYNDIKKNILRLYEPYKFSLYRKDIWISKMCDILYVLYTTNASYIDIEKYLIETLGYYKAEDYVIRDFFQYMIKYICFELDFSCIENRLIDFTEVEKRINYRYMLYKNNWSINHIEKFIFKLYNEERVIDEVLLTKLYKDIFDTYLRVEKVIQKRKGRPSLPEELKDLQKNKHKEEIKQLMKTKYIKSDFFDKVKDSLLTNEEFNTIKTSIKDPIIINKLNNLLKCNYIL